MSTTGYIAGAVASKLVRVANTTLFHLAAEYLGDATLWYVIAAANNLTDPWVSGIAEISIPQRATVNSNGGILGL